MPWELQVLGKATLSSETTTLHPERKTMGALTYLALEGATHRSKLAGLLWPDSDERAARNNLAQVLRRLKKTTDAQLITGEDTLALSSHLEVDAAKLKILIATGDFEKASDFIGELLGNYDYDDCPDFADWLFSERERLVTERSNALSSIVTTFEKQGNYRAALPYLEKMLELNPLAEEIHRQRMRYLYLAGDRASALAAYQQCQAILKRELDVEPMPETKALAKSLEAGEVLAQVPAHRPQLPLSILRPPRLVGREAAWQQLEAAWNTGQGVALCGEPGVGKSRLMFDFVNSKGDYEMVEGRPGDEAVSYASYSRSLRRTMQRHPDIVLPQWVRQELSRLLPDISDEPPPAITNETDKLRFFEGLAWMLETLIERGLKTIIIDDLQFMDTATFEVAQYQFSRLIGKVKTISCYRSNELSPAVAEAIEQAVRQGVVARIELQPLSASELDDLLHSLELTALPNPENLARFTGGNPLFVLETLKSLYEAGESGTGKLPTTGKVKSLIASRLSRLSQSALNLARCAAVLGTDFSLGPAAEVMGQAPLVLVEPLDELERLQIMQQGRFSHDLLFETVLEGIPAPVKTYLHRQAALSLEKSQGNPAKIAQHFIDANEQNKALPFLEQAAENAERDFQLIDAASFYERMAGILEAQGKTDEAFEALLAYAELLVNRNTGDAMRQILDKLSSLATNSTQQGQALLVACKHLSILGDAKNLELTARKGLDILPDTALRGDFLFQLGQAFWLQNDGVQAIPQLEQALVLQEARQDWRGVAATYFLLGSILFEVNQRQTSHEYLLKAERLYRDLGLELQRANALKEIGVNTAKQGYPKKALEHLTEAEAIIKRATGIPNDHIEILQVMSICWTYLAEERNFFECIQKGLALSSQGDYGFNGFLYLSLGRFYIRVGDYARAEDSIMQSLHWPGLPMYHRANVLMNLARVYHLTERDPGLLLDEIATLLERATTPVRERCHYLLLQADFAPARQAVSLATKAVELARAHTSYGEVVAGLSCLAKTFLKLNKPKQAHDTILEANQLLEQTQFFSYRSEVAFLYYQALKSLNSAEARAKLEETLAWVYDMADNRVPGEYRESFLNNNNVNKEILEAARLEGLLESKTSA